ncbi:hypothetical protein [Saliphagus sp. LR7]|uniref:hypothetical protein n=1 Tax=Saliphagus sp. LR7 TaxID=2282654 RepID=UPI000DF76CB4|nr:hypothetical protein [Saliphagus sp. LR7]
MYRPFLVVVGLVEIVAPNRLVEWGERLAFENPERARLRRWTIPIARLEGFLFVRLALRGAVPASARRLLAVVGLPLALAPDRTLAVALGAAYENAGEIELKPWVRPFARLLGAVYLLAALAGRADAPEETGTF